LSRNETKRRINNLTKSLELYALDHNGRYPSTAQGLKALYVKPEDDAAWNGPYVADLKDVWGAPIQYEEPSGDREPRIPLVWSLGHDKQTNTSDDIR
jgi:general secretion pathway protein G